MTKQMVEGPLGFPMPEAQARELDGIVKSLPKTDGYEYQHKSAPAEITFDDGERADVSLISTDALDRDREVVLPGSLDFKMYQKNPVVTFQHQYNEMPVGKCNWIRTTANGYTAKTVYPSKPDDWGDAPWLPSAIFQLVKSGAMPGKSVGILTTKIREPTDEDVVARPELAEGRTRLIEKALLLEYAVGTIPCNPDTVVQAVSQKSIQLPQFVLDELGIMVPTEPVEEVRFKQWNPKPRGAEVSTLKAKRTAADRLASVDGIVDRRL